MATIQRSATDTAGFIPQYWAQRALDVLRARIVLAQRLARSSDFSEGEFAHRGKSLTVPYPGRFTAQDKVEGTPITPQTPVGGQQTTLTLAKHKVIGFSIEDFVAAQANVELMDMYLGPAIIAVAEQFESDLWLTLMNAGATSPVGTPGTDLTAAVVRSSVRRLNDAKIPADDRHLIVSPKDQMALISDSTLSQLISYSRPDSIWNAQMGELYGVEVAWSQFAPATPQGYTVSGSAGSTFTFNGQATGSLTVSTTTAAALQTALAALSSVGAGNVVVSGPTGGPFNVVFTASTAATGTLTASVATVAAAQKNVLFHRNAAMFAVRQFAPISASYGVMSAQANDPDSGLSLRISAQYDINASAVRCNVDMLYGTVVLRNDHAVILDA